MKKIFKEFHEFAMRGNVIDLAVGIIIGASFNQVVNSVVRDMVMPPIGLVLGRVDFEDLYINLSGGSYESLALAREAGAVTINYGAFINTLISFVVTAFAVFILVRFMNRLHRKETKVPEKAPTTKVCPFCITSIPLKATRCPSCTSKLPAPSVSPGKGASSAA
jgi:large conductance mechanosensitive channel